MPQRERLPTTNCQGKSNQMLSAISTRPERHCKPAFRIYFLLLILWVLPVSLHAADFSIYIDSDLNPATGCSGTVSGAEVRVDLSTSTSAPYTVTSLQAADCQSGAFAPPVAQPDGFPIGLNSGLDASDVVEIEVALAALNLVSDQVVNATVVGTAPGSAPSVTQLQGLNLATGQTAAQPTQAESIPAMNLVVLTLLVGLLLLLGLRYLPARASLTVLLVITSGWLVAQVPAQRFVADGLIDDWIGWSPAAVSPGGSGSPQTEVRQLFFATEGASLFARLDVTDVEGPPPSFNLSPPPSLVIEKATVHLHADIGSGDGITWVQTAGPAVTLSGANTANPLFQAPDVNSRQTLEFEVRVSNGAKTSTQTLSLDVQSSKLAVDAGPDQLVNEGDTVTLSASATPSTAVSYAWTQLRGYSVALTDANTANPSFTATIPNQSGVFDGNLLFEVTVTESGTARTTTDQVAIKVRAPVQASAQTALSVNAGLDRVVRINDLVHLHAVASGGLTSSAGASGYTYSWVQTSGPAATLNNDSSANPDFTASNDGRYVFTVTVSDDNSTQKRNSVIVDVLSGLQIKLQGDRSVMAGQTVSLHPVITGGAGNYTYEWQADKPISYAAGSKTDPNPTISYNPTSTETVTMTLQVTDSSVTPALLAKATEKITFTVAPRVTSVDAGADKTVQAGDRVSLHALATPATGVAYRWQAPSGVTLVNETTANPAFTAPSAEGSYTFTVTASTTANSVTDTVSIIVQEPLSTSAGVDKTVNEGDAIYLHGGGAHGSGTYTYSWSVFSPVTGGGTFDDATIANAKFNPAKAGLEYTLQLSVTDSGTNTTVSDTVKITVLAKLTVDAGSDRTVAPNVAVTLHATTNLPGASFAWSENPVTGIAINNDTTDNADFTAPTLESLYKFDVTAQKTLTVAQAKDTVNVTVQAPLTTNAGQDLTITQGHVAALHGSATHGAAPYTYLWSIVTEPSTGAGAFDDSTTASPTFTPSKAGTYKLDFKATDNSAQSIHDTLTIIVKPSLQVDAGATQTTTAGKTLELRPSISGGSGGTLTYAWTLPAGVSLENGTSVTDRDIDVTSNPAATESKTLGLAVTDTGDGNQVVNDTVDLTWTFTPAPAAPSGTVAVKDPVVAAAIAIPCPAGQERVFDRTTGLATANCRPIPPGGKSYPQSQSCPDSAINPVRKMPAGAIFSAYQCGKPGDSITGPDGSIDCITLPDIDPPTACQAGEMPYVRLNNKNDGEQRLEMGCMSIQQCKTFDPAGTEQCRLSSPNSIAASEFSCTYCCVGDLCNAPVDQGAAGCQFEPGTLVDFN